jgi:hypothetical protein
MSKLPDSVQTISVAAHDYSSSCSAERSVLVIERCSKSSASLANDRNGRHAAGYGLRSRLLSKHSAWLNRPWSIGWHGLASIAKRSTMRWSSMPPNIVCQELPDDQGRILYTIHMYHNGGSCIACCTSSEKTITTSAQDKFLDQFNDEPHSCGTLRMPEDE